MKAALLEFELESATQNVGAFYASQQSTLLYLTRESVCSALSYTDSLWHNKSQEYVPLTFPFESTPAEPATARSVSTREVIYKAGDEQDVGLLRYWKQIVIVPGSRFRCAIWGDIPELNLGQIFLIGKKRAPARIANLVIDDVEPDVTSEGITLPVQLPPTAVMQQASFAPLVGTARYFIVKLPLTPSLRRFAIGGYVVPLPEITFNEPNPDTRRKARRRK